MAVQVTEFVLILKIMATLSNVSSMPKVRRGTNDTAQPLILTPMIQDGDVQSAQDMCKVSSLHGDVTSYAGFFTVNKTYNSNIFFWFFPASNGEETAPVIVWMFGGLGLSSLFSAFVEIGPYKISENLSLELNEPSLNNNFSVIYIDNPVGAGFSFTEDDQGYSTNNMEVGSNLYSALVQFFTLFPNYQLNDFYIVGESYGGNWAVVTSQAIHKHNPSAEVKINLKGLALGSALIDPISMVSYEDYYYQIGLIDSNEAELFHHANQEIVRLIKEDQNSKAFALYDSTIKGSINRTSLFKNITGYKYLFNYLISTSNFSDFWQVSRFLEQPNIRKALHVADAKFDLSSKETSEYLRYGSFISVKSEFEELLDHYKVLLFNGQLDLLVPYPQTVNFVSNLNWRRAAEFRADTRTQWYVGESLAGYEKGGGNLFLALVRNAGHFTAFDQPKWTMDLITRFINRN